MSRAYRRYLTLLLFGMFIFCLPVLIPRDLKAQDAGKETVKWLQTDYPGYHIHSGKYADQGIADKVRKLLWQRVSGYNHVIVKCNFKRVLETLKAREKSICLTLLKTPAREQFIHYSDLTSVKPSNGITTLEEKAHSIGEGPTVSLPKLLDNKQVKAGIMIGRSYGDEIDAILKQHENEGHIFVRTAEDGVQGLMKMLISNRIDYIICYPHEAFIVADALGIGDRITSFGLEDIPFLSYSYSGCPKTEWGIEFISQINDIYREVNILQQTSRELEKFLDKKIVGHFRKVAGGLY